MSHAKTLRREAFKDLEIPGKSRNLLSPIFFLRVFATSRESIGRYRSASEREGSKAS